MDNLIKEIRSNHSDMYVDNTLAAIRVSGKDNKKFLQGQLTNDIEKLSDRFMNTSYCTHQGKVIVNIQVFLSEEDVILLLSKSLSKYFIEKISKYILMSDVKFMLYSEVTALWSLGDKARELMREYKIEEDKLCSKISETEYVINMCMENSYQIRYVNLGSSNTSKFEYNELSETQTCLIDLFRLHTRLKIDNIEKFIPQVLNSDDLETVSYKKGCYTGQEVIARTHYLGNVKKHTYLVIIDAPINNETNVVNSDGESVGELIGETFTYQEVILSHCVLRDSSDFSDLFIKDNVIRVLAKEDIS
jgi:hypothetical protein